MGKAGKFLLLFLLIISLTGCDLIPATIGGNPVKLDEDQSHYFINEEGELRTLTCYEDKTYERTYDIDFDDDEDDIIDDLQDYFDDLDVDIEVADFQKDDDLGFMTTEADDFEPHLNQWFESLEDMADIYGDYEILAADIDFVTYDEDEDTLDDDLEDYEDGFVILINGGEKGNYYEFESDIAVVDDDMKYERIKNNIIFVEDDESGFVVLTDGVDCDSDLNPTTPIPQSSSPSSNQNTPIISDDLRTMPTVAPENLTIGQAYVQMSIDGTYQRTVYEYNDRLDWNLGTDASYTDAEIEADIINYFFRNYHADVEVTLLERKENGILYTIYCEVPDDLIYTYVGSLEETAEFGLESFLEQYSWQYFKTGADITSVDEIDALSYLTMFYATNLSDSTYYQFPYKIIITDDYMNWAYVDDYTIYIEGNSHSHIGLEK